MNIGEFHVTWRRLGPMYWGYKRYHTVHTFSVGKVFMSWPRRHADMVDASKEKK